MKMKTPFLIGTYQTDLRASLIEKIKDILNEVRIDIQVNSGRQKVNSSEKMFVDPVSVKEVMVSLKIKNSEGFEPILQRVLVNGVKILAPKFSRKFELIYD
jgi:hypothetical protein